MIFVPLCIAVAVLVAVRGFRVRSALRQIVFWSAIWVAAGVGIGFPKSATAVAHWLGIGRGADLVLYATVLAGIAACLYFYQRCRGLECVCTELVRRDAIRQACRGDDLGVGQPLL
jgi:hypothetical protein